MLFANFLLRWPIISHVLAGVSLVGDGQGLLQGAFKLASRDPVINVCFPPADTALRITGTGVDLEAVHTWSDVKTLAGDLSRLGDPLVLPAGRAALRIHPLGLPHRGGRGGAS